jgi:phenylpyruvate tautomerase PptA (4-oxalocrotonate tautomerase family)
MLKFRARTTGINPPLRVGLLNDVCFSTHPLTLKQLHLDLNPLSDFIFPVYSVPLKNHHCMSKMPFYEIQHAISLSSAQQQELASAITKLHANTFRAPSLFVNIKFTDSKNESYFIGGQKRSNANRIFVHLRSGRARSSQVLAKLAQEVERVWFETLGVSDYEGKVKGGEIEEMELHAVFIVPGLVARERGFAIPEVRVTGIGYGKEQNAMTKANS